MRYLLSLLLLASTAFADEAAVKALAPTLYLDINGATDATGLASGNTSNLTGTIKVGDNFGSVFLNADLIELITFNTALSPANQAVVEAYLNGVMSASADPWKRVSVLP